MKNLASTVLLISMLALSALAQNEITRKEPGRVKHEKDSPQVKPNNDAKNAGAKLRPGYAPVEVDSTKHLVLRIRVENKGETEVKKGALISAKISVVTRIGATKFVKCIPPKNMGGWLTNIDYPECIVRGTYLAAPIKPGESAWVEVTFPFMEKEFDYINYNWGKYLNDLPTKAEKQNATLGVVVTVSGGARDLVTKLDGAFAIQK